VVVTVQHLVASVAKAVLLIASLLLVTVLSVAALVVIVPVLAVASAVKVALPIASLLLVTVLSAVALVLTVPVSKIAAVTAVVSAVRAVKPSLLVAVTNVAVLVANAARASRAIVDPAILQALPAVQHKKTGLMPVFL